MHGERVGLRLVEESDLEELCRHSCEYENKNGFFPVAVHSIAALRRRFRKDGFWSARDSWVLITDNSARVVGCLYCFLPHPIMQSRELAYIIFDRNDRGHGLATEALRLFVQFIFHTTSVQRLELNVGTENEASIRVAEKAGFVREGTLHGVWFSPQMNRRMDCYRYGMLRDGYFMATRGVPDWLRSERRKKE